jgi:hypothetical protein
MKNDGDNSKHGEEGASAHLVIDDYTLFSA